MPFVCRLALLATLGVALSCPLLSLDQDNSKTAEDQKRKDDKTEKKKKKGKKPSDKSGPPPCPPDCGNKQ